MSRDNFESGFQGSKGGFHQVAAGAVKDLEEGGLLAVPVEVE
jgi:hypothetical protein